MRPESATLDGQIAEILEAMSTEEPWSETYAHLTDQLAKLYALKAPEKDRRVSPDAMLAVAGNLTAVLLVLNHERLGVISSKAMSFIRPMI